MPHTRCPACGANLRTLVRAAVREALTAQSRKGGARGGYARAAVLTQAQRSEIARRASLARWRKRRAYVRTVTPDGFTLMVDDRFLFVAFAEFPSFHGASRKAIKQVELLPHGHLRWPDLDVDLSLDSIEHPELYPLKAVRKKKGKSMTDDAQHVASVYRTITEAQLRELRAAFACDRTYLASIDAPPADLEFCDHRIRLLDQILRERAETPPE